MALCRLQAKNRRLQQAAWQLWWEGYSVPTELGRAFLIEAARQWDTTTRLLRSDAARGLSTLALSLLAKTATMRLTGLPVAQSRKRVGTDRFQEFARVMLETAVGIFDGYRTPEEAHVVEQALGLERARKDRLTAADAWLSGNTGPVLKELSQLLLQHPLSDVLSGVTDEDLEGARADLCKFVRSIDSVGFLLEHVFGRDAFGFSLLCRSLNEMKPQPQALLLLAWVLFRRHGSAELREGMESYLEAAPEAQEMLGTVRMLEQARQELPAFAEILAPNQIREALRYPHRMEYLNRRIRETRERHLEEVGAFFERHPEFRAGADTSSSKGESRPTSQP